MSMIPKCVVCDRPVHPYAPTARCERCSLPCPTCQGNVAQCKHPMMSPAKAREEWALQDQVAEELAFTIELEANRRAA